MMSEENGAPNKNKNNNNNNSNSNHPHRMVLPVPPPPPHMAHMPPVVIPPAPISAPSNVSNYRSTSGRYSPSIADHTSPEVTHAAYPPPPHSAPMLPVHQQPLQPHQHQFMQQFFTNMRAPSPPSTVPNAMAPSAPPASPAMMAPPSSVNLNALFALTPKTMPPRSISVALPATASSNHNQNTTSGSPRRGHRPGTRLTGEHVEYRPLGESQATESRSLEVTPITIYQSERHSPLGNLISVNEHFISYPIRNGLIRVINQSSVSRLLLRQHEQHSVTELAFFNHKTDLLLSAGTDQTIVIWAIQDEPMSREVVKIIRATAQRVKWHPHDSNQIAIVDESQVFVTDLTTVTAEDDNAEDLHAISIVCGQTTSQINDIAFSPCGSGLVTAGDDGFVHVYRLSDRLPGQRAEFVHRFEPFDGEAVNSLHFYSGNLMQQTGLLIGGDQNTQLSLWNAPLHETIQPTCYQTVRLVGDGTSGMHETLFDPSSQFLFVANRSKPVVYVFHLALSPNHRTPRRFDNVTEFSLAYPILSMSILNRYYGQQQSQQQSADSMDDFSMQLYCIQTQAIQRYHVGSKSCFVPFKPSTRPSVEEEIPAVETTTSLGQTVGAMTTEEQEQSDLVSHQAPAESPRAAGATPETEIDINDAGDQDETRDQDDEDQEEMTSQFSAPLSPAGPRITVHQDDASSSIGGEEAGGAPSLRSFARSSPTSSVRACQDEASLQYEPSLDDSSLATDASHPTILSYLRRMEAVQAQRDAQLREQMRVVMGNLGNHLTAQVTTQVDKAIQKQIQTVLVPAMGRIVLHTMENNFMKPVQAGFQRMMVEQVIPDMETKLHESLADALPDQMENGMKELVHKVVEDVRQPVRESFRECFQDIIIPSFQAATQKMFEQINDTFVKGTRSALLEAQATTAKQPPASNNQVQQQLKQLIDVVQTLSTKVDHLTAAGVASTEQDHLNGSASISNEERQVELQKKKVGEYLAVANYEEAFKLALGAQNVDLVAFTCTQCDARDVLCSRPPQLSQMLILCLVQQLGADLTSSDDLLSTKLSWLRESLLVMDVRDPTIHSFVTSVLQELQAGLSTVPANARDSQYTLLHHILNSMLSSTH